MGVDRLLPDRQKLQGTCSRGCVWKESSAVSFFCMQRSSSEDEEACAANSSSSSNPSNQEEDSSEDDFLCDDEDRRFRCRRCLASLWSSGSLEAQVTDVIALTRKRPKAEAEVTRESNSNMICGFGVMSLLLLMFVRLFRKSKALAGYEFGTARTVQHCGARRVGVTCVCLCVLGALVSGFTESKVGISGENEEMSKSHCHVKRSLLAKSPMDERGRRPALGPK